MPTLKADLRVTDKEWLIGSEYGALCISPPSQIARIVSAPGEALTEAEKARPTQPDEESNG